MSGLLAGSELVSIVRMPDVSGGLQAASAEPSPLVPDEFAAFVKSEMEKWAKVIEATGMTAIEIMRLTVSCWRRSIGL